MPLMASGAALGKIDVDEGVRLPFRSKQALQNERRIFLRCFPRYLAARRETPGSMPPTARPAGLLPGSGCTRIRDVFGEIGAAIDARQKNGRTHFHDLVDGEKRAQSVGVILTAKCRLSISRTRTGMFMEIECEAPDFSSSGTLHSR